MSKIETLYCFTALLTVDRHFRRVSCFKIGFHTQLTLPQGSNTEMTFSAVISILAELRTGPWGLLVPLSLGFALSEMHVVPEWDVVCFISHLQKLKLCLHLKGKAISAKNYRNDAANLWHNTQAP